MYGFERSARSTVASTSEKRIKVPPMVGVPAFSLCRSGPSERIGWPMWFAVRRRMSTGPSTKEMVSDISAASSVRKVM